MVQKIGYDMVTQDDVPGFNVNKNPVLYKIDSDGTDMFFSFQGDHPQWSSDGQSWFDFYEGSTGRKVYVNNYLKTSRIAPSSYNVTGRLTSLLYVEEQGIGILYVSWTFYGTYTGGWNIFPSTNSQMDMVNCNDPSDVLTFGDVIDRIMKNNGMELNAMFSNTAHMILRQNTRDLYVSADTVLMETAFNGTFSGTLNQQSNV
jgi:hypothetical protein